MIEMVETLNATQNLLSMSPLDFYTLTGVCPLSRANRLALAVRLNKPYTEYSNWSIETLSYRAPFDIVEAYESALVALYYGPASLDCSKGLLNRLATLFTINWGRYDK